MINGKSLDLDCHWEVWENPINAHGQRQCQSHWGPSGQWTGEPE